MAGTTFALEHKVRYLVFEFRAIEIGLLRYIGYDVKKALISQFLRGQALFFHKERDVKGRRLVSFSIVQKSGSVAVRISAYPLNIWERPFTRRGHRYAGKRVFSRKLIPTAERIAQGNAERYMNGLARQVESEAKV